MIQRTDIVMNNENKQDKFCLEHKPVMLQEAIFALNLKPNGVYVDATFGRGGHSRLILNQLGDRGKLIAIDLDPDAVKIAREMQKIDHRLSVFHSPFSNIGTICKEIKVNQVDGVLLDLGVSSPQLENASRGFSFMHDGPLDMRMDNTKGISAKDWLKIVDKAELSMILKQYGQERFANKIAETIVSAREQKPINTTLDLVTLVKQIYPKRYMNNKHPATKTFQAIRIFINQELSNLQVSLPQFVNLLSINGRLVIISFHSLEDTIVKKFITNSSIDPIANNYALRKLPIDNGKIKTLTLKNLGKLKPSLQEIKQNNRARSAIMRVAEKCA